MHKAFELTSAEITRHLDDLVDAVYADLTSSFLVMPRGNGFVDYPRFQTAYECLKSRTSAFRKISPDTVWQALIQDGMVLLVIRTILGVSPPEWADLAAKDSDVIVNQGAARSLDQKARTQPDFTTGLSARGDSLMGKRLKALIAVACKYLKAGAPGESTDTIHRLNKVDTADGLSSLQRCVDINTPYAVLLYERYLGRPFASHRDTVSELIGDVMESAVEANLAASRISYRKTKRAERVPGFDQAPDFIIPDELSPKVVIEAKITNDDGTARDKFTRLIHLAELSKQRIAKGKPGFQVIACIDGRGFGIRREDMRRLLLSLSGKVFTLKTLNSMIENSDLKKFTANHIGPS